MKAKVQKVQKKDFTWLIILILIAIPIIVEFAVGEALYNNSHQSILNAQKFMAEKLGLQMFEDTQDTQLKGTTKDIVFTEIVHLINSNAFYLILCAIIYNYANVYKVFVLAMTVFSANYVSITLSFIFHSPKPYMAFYKIKSGIVFNEWGSPNTQIVVLVSFFLSLYKALTDNKYAEKKICLKILLIILFIGYCLIDIFLLFASGNCTYNHIILSLFMGVVIFMIIFYSFKIELNKAKQFYDFIKINLFYYLAINALLFVFQFLLSYFMKNNGDEYYGRNGKIQVQRLPSNDFTKKYFGYRNMFFLNEGNLCNAFCFLMNIIAFISLKAEFHFLYKDNFKDWNGGNFEKTKIDAIINQDQSAQNEEYNQIEKSQWNHLGVCVNIIRFIFMILFIFVVFTVFIWINSWFHNEVYSFIFLIILPMAIHVFGTFFLYKFLLIKIKLGRPPKVKEKQLLGNK